MSSWRSEFYNHREALLLPSASSAFSDFAHHQHDSSTLTSGILAAAFYYISRRALHHDSADYIAWREAISHFCPSSICEFQPLILSAGDLFYIRCRGFEGFAVSRAMTSVSSHLTPADMLPYSISRPLHYFISMPAFDCREKRIIIILRR